MAELVGRIERLDELLSDGELVLRGYDQRGNIDRHDLWITAVQSFLKVNAPEFLEAIRSVAPKYRERLLLEPYGRAAYELIQEQIEVLRDLRARLETAGPADQLSGGEQVAPEPASELDRSTLRRILVGRFSADELNTLCFDLGMDHEDLVGTGKAARARELIAHCERRDLLGPLVDAIRRERPGVV